MIARFLTICVLLLALLLSIAPAPALAQSCGAGGTEALYGSYPGGATYILSVPAGCYRFHPLGSSVYQISLGTANYAQSGDVYLTSSLFDGLVTNANTVELFTVIPSATSTPSITPTPAITCVDVASDGFFEVFVDTSYEGWIVSGNADGGGIDLWTSNVARARRWSSGVFSDTLTPTSANNPPFFQPHGPGYYFGPANVNHSYTLTFCSGIGSSSTPTPTLSPTVTVPPTPTTQPGLACVTYMSSGSPPLVFVPGDQFGKQVRGYPIPVEGEISIDVHLVGGSTTVAHLDTGAYYSIGLHTTSMSFSSSNGASFFIQLCSSAPASTPTITSTPGVFGTPTYTRTPTSTPTSTNTPTGTILPSSTPTVTPTPTDDPTPTLISTCLTPESEDSAECVLIGIGQTQVALQQTLVAPYSTPGPLTPVITRVPPSGSASTVVAALCSKDPCYNLMRMNEIATGSLTVFTLADDNVCRAPTFPFAFGTGLFGIGNYIQVGFGNTICWFIDTTTPVRNIMRFLSIIGVFFMLYKYYVRTVRRLGDV